MPVPRNLWNRDVNVCLGIAMSSFVNLMFIDIVEFII